MCHLPHGPWWVWGAWAAVHLWAAAWVLCWRLCPSPDAHALHVSLKETEACWISWSAAASPGSELPTGPFPTGDDVTRSHFSLLGWILWSPCE